MSDTESDKLNDRIDLNSFATDEGGIWSLRDLEKVRGWNNIEYAPGLSVRILHPPDYQ